jgi:hypothetical protein
MKKHMLYALVAVFTLFVTACQKENLESDDAQVSASQSSSESASLVEEAEDEAAYRMLSTTSTTGCPTITWAADRGTFPNTCTIDFGTGCTGRNGHEISGQITVEVSAPYFDQGSVRTTSTSNLTIDGNAVAFTRNVTNQGLNSNEQMYWTVEVSGTRVRDCDNAQATWSASRTRTMTAGLETEEVLEDDVYEITGGATGISHKGHPFTSTITTPLIKRGDCRWIVSGVETMTGEGRRGQQVQRSLDFGDGSCDDKGILTLGNGDTREITLRRPFR